MTNTRWISYTGHTVIDNPNLNVYDAALARIRHLFTLSPNYYAKKHATAFPEDGDTLSWKSFCFRMSKNDRMKGSSRDRA